MARLALIKSRLRDIIRRLIRDGKTPKEISVEVSKYLKANSSSFKRIGRSSMAEVQKEFAIYKDVLTSNTSAQFVRKAAADALRAVDADLAATGKFQIKELTDVIQKALEDGDNVSAVVSKINKQFGSATFKHTTIVRSAKKAFNRLYTVQQAIDAGCTKFRWAGPSGASHDLCKRNVGKVFTLDEINAMSNHQIGSVLAYMGGYNCRHHWEPVWD